jgi:hypothetical protein
LISDSSSTSVRRVFWRRIAVPLCQVAISRITPAANTSGTQAFSKIFRRFAAKNERSTRISGPTSSAASTGRQPQSFQMMTKASSPSTTMVVATAMP